MLRRLPNAAAAMATAGATIGVTLSYAGGNIGDGPGWWVVVFSAAIATAGLFACWLASVGTYASVAGAGVLLELNSILDSCDGAVEAKFPLDALPVKVEWKSVRQTATAPRPIPDGRAYSGYSSTPPEVGRLKRMKASTFPGSEVASLRSPPI